ncbi:MAG: hypothetical protein WEB63_08195 [Cucumibacter sp.]
MSNSTHRRGKAPPARETFREFAWRLAGALGALKQARGGEGGTRAGIRAGEIKRRPK